MTVLAEGKTKILSPHGNDQQLLVSFKDAATAFNGGKFEVLPGKGELNARISRYLFELLNAKGIPTCYVGPGGKANELVYERLSMIPLEVVIRNYAYGSICKRFGFEQGLPFKRPLLEFFLKADEAGDPQITEGLIAELGVVPAGTSLDALSRLAFAVNEVFLAFFAARGIRCADFKLEFGLDSAGVLKLGDELSPDNFRLRDTQTGQILDKDVFRLDLGDLIQTYTELLRRIESPVGETAAAAAPSVYQAEVLVHSRQNILNPESKTILGALHTLGYADVKTLRAGKRFEIGLETASQIEAERQIRTIAEQVLSNPVIEDFSYQLGRPAP